VGDLASSSLSECRQLLDGLRAMGQPNRFNPLEQTAPQGRILGFPNLDGSESLFDHWLPSKSLRPLEEVNLRVRGAGRQIMGHGLVVGF
jgi:hypothetical protein